MRNVIDQSPQEFPAVRIDRKLDSTGVIDVLTDLFLLRVVPGHARSGNGQEFIAKAVRGWIDALGAKAAFVDPGSPWENGYCESFTSKLLDGEIFYSLAEARVVIEARSVHLDTARPHSSLGYRPPANELIREIEAERSAMLATAPADDAARKVAAQPRIRGVGDKFTAVPTFGVLPALR